MASPLATGSVDNLDVQGARVAVEWTKPDGQTSILCTNDSEAGQITFDCHFRPTSNVASFRLRASLLLKGLGRKTSPFFVVIPLEQVESLTCGNPKATQVSEGVRKTFGEDDLVSLHFTLRQPVDLVVPPHNSLVPKKKVFWDLFDSLKMLAQETRFAVYLNQASVPSMDSLSALCDAVTAGKLATSIAHVDIARLYDGKGGKVLSGGDLGILGAAPADLPPSYDNAGPSPPAPPVEKGPMGCASLQEQSSGSSRKRRRASSTGTGIAKDANNMDANRVEDICRKMMDEMTAKWRVESEQLRAELQQMEARMKDWMNDRLNKHVETVRAEMQQTSVELQNDVDDRVGGVSIEVQESNELVQEHVEKVEEVEKKLETVRDETAELVDERLDERIEVLRDEMEEYVADQLHEAENRVIDRLRSSVYIDFGIYE